MTSVGQIRERIAQIPEPCALAMRKTTTIGQMGLIEAVELAGGHVRITLCLTDAACVHFGAMQRYIADVLSELPDITEVTVQQTTSALWTPDRMQAD
jgi:metal-sulfur cluster biosynthetic enzyme